MEHNYPEKECPHGMCLGHDPVWENIGEKRFKPAPSFFGLKKTYWTIRCCGKPMRQVNEVQTQQCKKCGRRREDITRQVALCACCDRQLECVSYDYF